jgi:hypothetical protein
MGAVQVDGYMIDASWDGETLRVHAHNKAASVALQGKNRGEDVVVTRDHIAAVAFKPAGALVNGKVTVTTVQGAAYQLHFRRKQQPGMDELAVALQSCG